MCVCVCVNVHVFASTRKLQCPEICTYTFKHAHAQFLHSLEDCYAHSARGPVHISSNEISGTVGDEVRQNARHNC